MTRYNLALEKMERELFSLAMKECNNNQLKAAEALGISRRMFGERLVKYGMHTPKERPTKIMPPPISDKEFSRLMGYKGSR